MRLIREGHYIFIKKFPNYTTFTDEFYLITKSVPSIIQNLAWILFISFISNTANSFYDFILVK
jgi:hypothetical protein